ncbi:transposase [Frankia tisae]|uniref:transposase n=1 Tax=Frankia tisae TaxID=2950104 RepID=UPI003555F21D
MPAPRKYPVELRERSVRLVMQMRREQPAEAHRAISMVAKRLDVHPATLRLWVNQADVDQGPIREHARGPARRTRNVSPSWNAKSVS